MSWFKQIGSFLDTLDKPEGASAADEETSAGSAQRAEAEAEDEEQSGLGNAIMGRGLGLLTSAASAANSAAAVAGSAAAKAGAAAAEAAAQGAATLMMNAEGSDDEPESSDTKSPAPARQEEDPNVQHQLLHSATLLQSESGTLQSAATTELRAEEVDPSSTLQAAIRTDLPTLPLPSSQDGQDVDDIASPSSLTVAAAVDSARAPHSSPPASLASSARDIAAAGWHLEEVPTEQEKAELEKATADAAAVAAPAASLQTLTPAPAANGGAAHAAPASLEAETVANGAPRGAARAVPLTPEAETAVPLPAPMPSVLGAISPETTDTSGSEEFTHYQVGMGQQATDDPASLALGVAACSESLQDELGLAPSRGRDEEATAASQEELRALEAANAALKQELSARDRAEADSEQLRIAIRNLEAQGQQERDAAEVQLVSATQQVGRLQGRMVEVEEENQQLHAQLAAAQKVAEDLQQGRAHSSALEKQVEELKREVAKAQKQARDEAHKEKEAILGEVRSEMEQELEHMLKQKDDQLRALEGKVAAGEKARRDLQREVEKHRAEAESLHAELESLQQEGAGKVSDHQRQLDGLTLEHRRQIEELEQRADFEQRQKHELTLSLRSVEERARGDLARLEADKAQLELQFANLQRQLQEEQQKCADLSLSLGETQQRLGQFDGSAPRPEDEAVLAAEAEARELRMRLENVEGKLLESQSMRDLFSKETDMYRTELKTAREERTRLEEELHRVQDRLKDAQAAGAQAEPSAAEQSVVQIMQRDFDARMERSRDEVQYLRQKCDEKERRCEQLLAEKSSLSAQLRGGGWREPEGMVDSTGDLESGAKAAGKSVAKSGRSSVRSLPLLAPGWMRSADEPLRLVVKTLATYPHARLIFFAYVVLLHFWVLFVLQQQAVQGSTNIAGGLESNPPPTNQSDIVVTK